MNTLTKTFMFTEEEIWGSMVAWWLELFPHSKRVLGLNPPSGCLRVLYGFSPGILASSHSPTI